VFEISAQWTTLLAFALTGKGRSLGSSTGSLDSGGSLLCGCGGDDGRTGSSGRIDSGSLRVTGFLSVTGSLNSLGFLFSGGSLDGPGFLPIFGALRINHEIRSESWSKDRNHWLPPMSEPPSPFVVSAELAEFVRKLADWAEPARGTVIYLYGSRVRGDHQADSDVDICIHFASPTSDDINWWSKNNLDDFQSISTALGARVEILERNSPIRTEILIAPVVFQDRNVRCVWRKQHAKI
jgi:predicted nucleotidyltransferase